MKTALRYFCMLVISWATWAAAKDRGPGEILFVEGARTEAEILFTHPHAPLLIVRSPRHSTAQSFPLALVQSYTVEGRVTQVNPARALTAEEAQERERNALWGDEAGPGQVGHYAKETWERRPLVVWARPGESGDARDPANWLDENGNPLEQLHWTLEDSKRVFDGDILLPAADTGYAAIQPGGWRGPARGPRDSHVNNVRHLTVERNARYSLVFSIRGNFWMKDGSMIGMIPGASPPAIFQSGGLGSGNANKHTFMRFCNYHDEPNRPAWAYVECISHLVNIDTGDSGSLEVIGLVGGPRDRIWLNRGTLIISKDSAFRCGNRAGFYTVPGTTLVLLDGAMIGSPESVKSIQTRSGTYGIAGTVMFGTPDRPLTRDFDFTACLYWMKDLDKNALPCMRTMGASWVFGPTSRAVVHSSDPTTARVVFAPRSRDLPTGTGPGNLLNPGGNRSVPYGAPKSEFWDHPDVPKGVIAVFRGQTEFDGVVFDGFYEGGIVVDPSARARWRNVFFGTNNLAAPEKLFSSLE